MTGKEIADLVCDWLNLKSKVNLEDFDKMYAEELLQLMEQDEIVNMEVETMARKERINYDIETELLDFLKGYMLKTNLSRNQVISIAIKEMKDKEETPSK